MSAVETNQEIVRIRPWPCEAICDEPNCRKKVDYAVVFRFARPIDTLYLCYAHMIETAQNYGHRV